MERDDIIEYSLDAHHSDEEGKAKRKKIWIVTGLLSAITIAEVLVGVFFPRNAVGIDSGAWTTIKIFYIVLTIVKAGYIVLSFMHLGDERKGFKYVVLIPYLIFMIYMIVLILYEGNSFGVSVVMFK